MSKNKKYWEKIGKINGKTPAANLYTVTDEAPWFWPDENLAEIVAIRKARFQAEPDRVLHTDDNDPAVREAAQLLLFKQAHYLVTNFPEIYSTQDKRSITNLMTGDTFPVNTVRTDWHPLAVSGLLGQEDICIIRHTDDDKEVLAAGFLATPTDWDLSKFVGRDMDGIHDDVEGYHQPVDGNKPLKDTVDKVFVRLRTRPDLKLARNNMLLYQNPSQAILPGQAPTYDVEDVTGLDRVYIRSEYETLTAINESFAAFTIAPKVTRLSDIASGPRHDELRRYLEMKSRVGNKQLLARKALEYLTA